MCRDGALVEHRGLLEFRIFLRLGDHAFRFRLVHGDRLFHDDVFALPHGKNRQIGMGIVRHGNHDRVDVGFF